MNIKIIEDINSFLELRDDWNMLAKDLIPINGFDWLYKWWNHFQDKKELKIVVAEEDGKIVGIAPLYINNTRALKFIPIKKLCFLGGDISDYLDFLIADRNTEQIYNALIDFIHKHISFDQIEFIHINSHYPNFSLWRKNHTDTKNFMLQNECPGINLANYSSYDDYFSGMNKNLRKSIKFRQRKSEKDGINVEYIFNKNITEQDIDTIARINLKRQIFLQQRGDTHRFCYFTDKKKDSFIRDFFCTDKTDNKLLCYTAYNGTVTAYDLALLSKDKMILWNCGFDPDYSEYSPLKLLINEIIKYSFDNGYKYVDFLRGKDPYKTEWTDDLSVNYNSTFNKSAKAKIISCYRNNAPDYILNLFRTPYKGVSQNKLPF